MPCMPRSARDFLNLGASKKGTLFDLMGPSLGFRVLGGFRVWGFRV